MKIAFYAPLKSPDHPVPSGDRLMARQLIAALALSGHDIEIVSHLRSFSATPEVPAGQLDLAGQEVERIAAAWRRDRVPDVWICYHPYYKSPDRLGVSLCRQFGIPYVTVESSYSARRNIGDWAVSQNLVREAMRMAAVNICLTARDCRGILEAVPEARVAMLAPFIDVAPFVSQEPVAKQGRLVTVAMMRPGDKLSSYQALAAALSGLRAEDWTLDIVGDGPARPEVEAAFAPIAPDRLRWHGELPPEAVRRVLADGAIYVWPGHGEAYGLAYLEAQAAGLPVIAEAVAGVPEVVRHEATGLLVSPQDQAAYASAILRLLTDETLRRSYATAARRFVMDERSLQAASVRLDDILQSIGRAL